MLLKRPSALERYVLRDRFERIRQIIILLRSLALRSRRLLWRRLRCRCGISALALAVAAAALAS